MADAPVPLVGNWRLWNQFALRGPGFPAAGVLRLAPEGLAAEADSFAVGEVLSGAGWEAFEKLFGDASVETALVLQEIAALPLFRSAVAWQNRAVLTSGIAPFLSWVPSVAGRTSMPRQREELVAHYWQRFCVKNDTIGFFGPVGWGRWDLSRRGLVVEPGVGLIAGSQVYFSSWAIDTLARIIGAEPRLREWIAPRRVSFVRVADGVVSVPGRPPQEIPSLMRQTLELCDGTRSARRIQQELPAGVDAVEVLSELANRRWIVWRLELPADTHPERYLRAWLEQVGDPALRQWGLEQLGVLERGRDRVRASLNDADTLSATLAEMEADFVKLTDTAAVREKGATTAPCRALVYSDCVRAARASLGDDVLAAMAPLELLLTSATWLTSTLAGRVMKRARRVFDQLSVDNGGNATVNLAAFWFACMPILHGDAVADAAEIQNDFWRRWSEVLRLPAGSRQVRLSSVDITDRIRDCFGERGEGWTAARYLSPDVMIVASDPAAVADGDFELVLGELHIATNTLGASLFVNQHPAAGDLFAQTTLDHPGPRLMPLLPKEHKSRLSARIRHCLVRPEDYYVALVDYTADAHRPRTVMSADVNVELREDRLVAVLPDGAVFAAVDVFAHVLTTLVMDMFRILPESDHTPRVTVDKMVLARETWRFAAGELDFTLEKNEARRFVRTRRWRDGQELPRFVFVTSPAEPRPFFVDFDSPVYVNILAKAARRLARKDPAGRLTITEMLPTPEQTWLTDDQGDRYTSELRFVAVELDQV